MTGRAICFVNNVLQVVNALGPQFYNTASLALYRIMSFHYTKDTRV